MITYFPTPYKDELLYSLMLRYHIHSASVSSKQTMFSLFNNANKHVINDFPNDLDNLIGQISNNPNYFTGEYLIQKHTILPFYKPFLTPIKYKQIIEALKKGIRSNLVKNSIGGIDNNKIEENMYFCRSCIIEQKQEYGEFYINRVHQIPCVFVCTKHKEMLVKYSYNLYAQQSLAIIEEEKLEEQKLDLMENEQVKKWLFQIAEDMEWLIDSNLEPMPCEHYFRKYKALMDIKGISYPISKKRNKINKGILEFFPSEILSMLNFNTQKESPNWMRYIFSNQYEYLHPSRHLVLIYYLCGSIKDFFEKEYTFEPFGKGPWICMNPFASHYLERCIHDVNYTVDKNRLILRADFKCECGFVYRLFSAEDNPLNVKTFNRRIVSLGNVWYKEVKKLIEEGVPINVLQERSGFTKIAFNNKIMNFEQIKVESKHEKCSRKKIEKFEEIRKERRSQWMKQFRSHPNYSRSQLIKLDAKLYRWMMRYDREWIEKHTTEAIKNTRWSKDILEEKDRELLGKVKKLVSEWYKCEEENNKLMRITKEAIERKLNGEGGKLQINTKIYRRTIEYIQSVAETTYEFYKRKVLFCLQTEFQDKVVTFNKIKYAAGLYVEIRKEFHAEISKDLKDFITQQVILHNGNIGLKRLD